MKLLSILILLFAVGTMAQSSTVAPIRVAVIDSDRFISPTSGIKKLVVAEQTLEASDSQFTFPRPRLEQQISELESEIAKLRCSDNPLNDKMMDLANLKRAFKELEDSDKAAFEKRRLLIVDPILTQIRALLKEYAAKNGIGMILDKCHQEAILVEHVGVLQDITENFIEFCNNALASKK